MEIYGMKEDLIEMVSIGKKIKMVTELKQNKNMMMVILM